MPFSIRSVLLACAAALALAPAAHAAPRYSVNVVGGAGSVGFDINNSGQVVGRSVDTGGIERAFLHSGSGMVDLGTLGGAFATAYAINDAGTIVGYAATSSGLQHAFRYAGGSMSDLGTLGGESSTAFAINRAGHIAGGSSTSTEFEGVLYEAWVQKGGAMTPIGTLPDGDMSYALGINNSGAITGVSTISTGGAPEHPSQGFVYMDGVFTDIPTLGGLYSTGQAINDDGWVVGDASTTIDFGSGHTTRHAILFRDGVVTDLGTFGGLYSGSEAHDINGLGQIVGWASDALDTSRAFLFEAGALLDLNTLIDPTLGWTLEEAYAINDSQQIAVTGCKAGGCYALRLDLVTAVPEPGTYLMLLAGMALVAGATRRRQA